MLQLCYSNDLAELALTLADDLATQMPSGDPFASATVAVPSRGVATLTKHCLARRHRIAANIEFLPLDAILASIAERNAPGRVVLDRLRLQLLVCSRLADEVLLAHPEMSAVRDYLGGSAAADGIADHEHLQRRVQLSERVARLYVEYSLHRPQLLARWTDGPAEFSQRYAEQERWQRRLWLAVTGDVEAFSLPCPLLEALDPDAMKIDGPLRLLGFATLPQAHLQALAGLSQSCDVHAYLFNPCREYWEDVAAESGDLIALHRWAQPVRHSVRAVSELVRYDFRQRFVEPCDDSSVLHRLQRRVLDRTETLDPIANELDESLCILACTGIRRELEVIARGFGI